MKMIMMPVVFLLLMSSMALAAEPAGIMINWLNANWNVQAGTQQPITAELQNYGTGTATINLEAGIYADQVITGWGIPVASFTPQAANCGSEDFAGSRSVTLDAGQKQEITITVKAPLPDSKLKDGAFGQPKTPNWGSSFTAIAGLYQACGQGYQNDKGQRGGLYSYSPCGTYNTCGVYGIRNVQIYEAAATPQPIECDPQTALTSRDVCVACGGKWAEEGFASGALKWLVGGETKTRCSDIPLRNAGIGNMLFGIGAAFISSLALALTLTIGVFVLGLVIPPFGLITRGLFSSGAFWIPFFGLVAVITLSNIGSAL